MSISANVCWHLGQINQTSMTTFSKKSLFESQREGFRFEGVGSNPDVFQNKASQNITKNVYKIIVYNQSILN